MIARLFGVVGGVVGLAIWWLLVSSLMDALGEKVRDAVLAHDEFTWICVAAAFGLVLSLGIGFMWVAQWLAALATRSRSK